MNIGKAFKEIREEKGLTRIAVADGIGCTPSALSKIERGKTDPKRTTIERFCDIARIPIAYFYIKALDPADYYLRLDEDKPITIITQGVIS